jgi:hypothetical protein
MKSAIPLVFAALLATAVDAQTETAAVEATSVTVGPLNIVETDLSDFKWEKRPIVVFADSDQDPRFKEQISLLTSRLDALEARDVVILTDTDPDNLSELREKLRPRGFMMVLIGKDGGVKLRKPFPWDVREISRVIDKMPLRREELRSERQAAQP